jgi:CheY-like chemotaxis protein
MGKKILLVEDFAEARAMMRFELERLGHSIIEAVNGNDAVTQAIASHPDLILMDICMPGKDGLEATEEILAIDSLKHTPIGAITALGEDCREKAISLGCKEVLNKPVDASSIGDLIERHTTKS